ncbi:peroxisomal membrane protein PEX14 [Episyrphus balteatus]|uniref:peroxisomal membrane protein PEX14 n=1 Tax=Episyrphus balteatus TaxID=286459 RepID=UPI002486AB2D|nr:peroxisomal membrane protein PEX14 [Episyrphus balteatus]
MSDSNTDTGDTILSNKTEINSNNNNSSSSLSSTILTTGTGVTAIVPRESLITTAVNFLQNAKVRHSTLIQKQQFLRSKGLSPEEIQLACERAGIFNHDPNSTVINMGISTAGGGSAGYMNHHHQQIVQRQGSTLQQIREALQSMALISGLAYAVYLFYKKYIEPFLFGKKKKKSVEETLTEFDQKVETQMRDVNRDLNQIKEQLTQNITTQNSTIQREFSNFKSDLEAIKGLLLNRKQFANPIPTVPPSIPAWQLTSHRLSQSDNEKNDDAGSGSGSSETEVVTKNSDSSLEIM